MIVAYAFIGKLPSYSIDTVYQTRLFFDGPIYFIVSDMESEYLPALQNKYNVKIINYTDVIDNEFIELACTSVLRTAEVPRLGDRSGLFIRSFERFYVLHKLMIKENIENVFFMELDNLIYDDPRNWYTAFSRKNLCYMYDHKQRCSSGICFIKTHITLNKMLTFFSKHIRDFVSERDGQINEMTALALFYEDNKELIQILPTHWSPREYPVEYSESFELYNSIFDSAALGIYFFGLDPYHTEGKIVKYKRWWGSLIDYTVYRYEWKIDDKGRNIPFIFIENTLIRIMINSKK